MTRGIVWDGTRLALTDRLELRPPGEGEVGLRVLRSGLCHSDLNMMAMQGAVPMVLGHEAAAEITTLGPGVTGWQVGERVMVGTQRPCGTCRECRRGTPANCDKTWGYEPDWPFTLNGKPVAAYAHVASFAGEIVANVSQLYRTGTLPPEEAALVGCAVSTGYAAAVRLARAAKGDRIVVFGVGGIGVNAMQAARRAGADVLAVDINPGKEEVARHFGATRFVLAGREDSAAALVARIRAAFAPVDTAIECSGAPVATQTALDVVKRGGRVVLVGMAAPGGQATLHLDHVLGGCAIVSQLNGGARPEEDYPEIIHLAETHALDIAGQVSRVWPLADFEAAIAALRAGKVTRAILDHTC